VAPASPPTTSSTSAAPYNDQQNLNKPANHRILSPQVTLAGFALPVAIGYDAEKLNFAQEGS
jgi:hypothetical protein